MGGFQVSKGCGMWDVRCWKLDVRCARSDLRCGMYEVGFAKWDVCSVIYLPWASLTVVIPWAAPTVGIFRPFRAGFSVAVHFW